MRQPGLFGYFNLLEWFNSSFSEKDKQLIQKNFRPMGLGYNDLIEGESTMPIVSPVWLLYSVAGNLIAQKDTLDIGLKFLEKGESLISTKKSYSDLHFLYLLFCKAYKSSNAPEKALEYAKKMIDISEQVSQEFITEYGKNEVSHQGFIDYIEYLEGKGETDLILAIEQKAIRENWRGPWGYS